MDELQELTESAPTAAAVSETLPTITYDVVRYRGSWRVLHAGKHSAPHPSQKAAIDSALQAATQEMANGRAVAVRLNRTDGQVFDLACPTEHA